MLIAQVRSGARIFQNALASFGQCQDFVGIELAHSASLKVSIAM